MALEHGGDYRQTLHVAAPGGCSRRCPAHADVDLLRHGSTARTPTGITITRLNISPRRGGVPEGVWGEAQNPRAPKVPASTRSTPRRPHDRTSLGGFTGAPAINSTSRAAVQRHKPLPFVTDRPDRRPGSSSGTAQGDRRRIPARQHARRHTVRHRRPTAHARSLRNRRSRHTTRRTYHDPRLWVARRRHGTSAASRLTERHHDDGRSRPPAKPFVAPMVKTGSAVRTRRHPAHRTHDGRRTWAGINGSRCLRSTPCHAEATAWHRHHSCSVRNAPGCPKTSVVATGRSCDAARDRADRGRGRCPTGRRVEQRLAAMTSTWPRDSRSTRAS